MALDVQPNIRFEVHAEPGHGHTTAERRDEMNPSAGRRVAACELKLTHQAIDGDER